MFVKIVNVVFEVVVEKYRSLFFEHGKIVKVETPQLAIIHQFLQHDKTPLHVFHVHNDTSRNQVYPLHVGDGFIVNSVKL